MEPHGMSIDELIAASADLDDRAHGLFGRLAAVTAHAAGESGVAVTVNLDGMIIGLELTDAALRLGPDRLAAEIARLTHQAAGAAVALGLDILEPVLEPIAGEDLRSLLDLPEPAPGPTPADDFAEIETWVLPR